MSVIGPAQFASGDQTNESRKAFIEADFRQCIKCKQTSISAEKHVDSCRMNGDAYGTTTFTCVKCGWNTSFQWDEASDDYYYEIKTILANS